MATQKHINKNRGVTLVEVLVALVVAGVFLSGAFAAFIQILKATEKAEIRTEAINNARAALELMAIDIKSASMDLSRKPQYFIGTNRPLNYGDGIDNDGDGRVDEELLNGEDDDGDWRISNDNHSVIGTMIERWLYVGAPDLGDNKVDEDFKFNRDSLTFRIFPDPLVPVGRDELITYEIGTYEGENNVLLRRVKYFLLDGNERIEVAPLAFNVLSLNFLYWDPNQTPPRWVNFWDGPNAENFPPPGIELPVSVFISLTIYAGSDPIERYRPWQPVHTITLSTIVNIEQVLDDVRYQRLLKNIKEHSKK